MVGLVLRVWKVKDGDGLVKVWEGVCIGSFNEGGVDGSAEG